MQSAEKLWLSAFSSLLLSTHAAEDNYYMAKILVVDDEIGIRSCWQKFYDKKNIRLDVKNTSACAARLRARPDLVLLDIWMPDTDGVSLLKRWGAQGLLDMPVVMMSGHATIDTAVEATCWRKSQDFEKSPLRCESKDGSVITFVTSCCS